VASRVKKGGHNIPTDVIKRRYKKGIENFVSYSDECHDSYLYDNSNPGGYELIAKMVDEVETIINFELFNKIIKA
jgi:predicted ABC-type ATPase